MRDFRSKRSSTWTQNEQNKNAAAAWLAGRQTYQFVNLAKLIGILFISSGLQIGMAEADTWRGTAPFCAGNCLPGEQEIQRSNCGDGACCWTGSKALCRNASPTCQALQTNVSCKGVVLICENGFYTQTSNRVDWHSCSRYACGACLGWWTDWKEPLLDTGRGLSPLSLPSLPRIPETRTLPNLPWGPDTCKSGFVWRETIAHDNVCVVPASRDQAWSDNAARASRVNPTDHTWGPDTCIPGYVWREAVPTDHVCVTPQIRAQTSDENQLFEVNRVREQPF